MKFAHNKDTKSGGNDQMLSYVREKVGIPTLGKSQPDAEPEQPEEVLEQEDAEQPEEVLAQEDADQDQTKEATESTKEE